MYSFIADVHYKTCRDPDVIPINNETYDAVYKDLPTTHFVLRKVPICEYCGAKRFPGEGPGFCCRKGKVSIFSAPIPDELRRLFTSQNDSDAQYFRKNIRYFNSHFSFTSFGVSIDRRVATAAGNPSTFCLHYSITSDIAAIINFLNFKITCRYWGLLFQGAWPNLP